MEDFNHEGIDDDNEASNGGGSNQYNPEEAQDPDSFQLIESSGIVNIAKISEYSGELITYQVTPNDIEELETSSVRDMTYNSPGSPRRYNCASEHIVQEPRFPPTSFQVIVFAQLENPQLKKHQQRELNRCQNGR